MGGFRFLVFFFKEVVTGVSHFPEDHPYRYTYRKEKLDLLNLKKKKEDMKLRGGMWAGERRSSWRTHVLKQCASNYKIQISRLEK